ncbi:MAG: hypothetical protein O3C57_08500 [Verrucomicrobia bacterium]|nr:hypothetical protein [Verrucomicrobiota bacterium]
MSKKRKEYYVDGYFSFLDIPIKDSLADAHVPTAGACVHLNVGAIFYPLVRAEGCKIGELPRHSLHVWNHHTVNGFWFA